MKKRFFKRILALLLIFTMVIPCLPIMVTADGEITVTAENVTYVTDIAQIATAEKISAWLESGESDGIYEIANREDLACFMSCGIGTSAETFFKTASPTTRYTVKLTDNVVWNDFISRGEDGSFVIPQNSPQYKNGKYTVFVWSPYAKDVPMSTDTVTANAAYNSFRGRFDGNDKSISGIYIANGGGFFGKTGHGVEIKNVSFINTYVTGNKQIGALVDVAAGTLVVSGVDMRCTVNTANSYVSPLIKQPCSDTRIENVSVDCDVTAASYVGGIIAYPSTDAKKITIKDCTVSGRISAGVENDSGIVSGTGIGSIYGVVRDEDTVVIENCVNSANVTLKGYVKQYGFVGRSAGALELINCFDTAWYNGGQGINGRLVIYTREQLMYFSELGKTVDFEGKTVELGADIVFNVGDASEDGFSVQAAPGGAFYKWIPYDTSFKGTFNGNGHTVSGLYISCDSQTTGGFFKSVTGATIKNVTFDNAYLNNKAAVASSQVQHGFLVGVANGACVFENVCVKAFQNYNSTNLAAYIGGICGLGYYSSSLTFKNCTVSGKINAPYASMVGGLYGGTLGQNSSTTMINCINYANVVGNTRVAGLIGEVNGSVSAKTVSFVNCASFGNVSADGSDVITGSYVANGEIIAADYYDTAFSAVEDSDLYYGIDIEGLQQTLPYTQNGEELVDVRLVASISFDEELNLTADTISEIGFEVYYSIDGFNKGQTVTGRCSSVYKQISSSFDTEILTSDEFGADYIGTLVLKGAPTELNTLFARPYCKDNDGNVYYGSYKVWSFKKGAYMGGVSIDRVDVTPIALAVSYDTQSYDLKVLVSGGTDFIVSDKSGASVDSVVQLTTGENIFYFSCTLDGVQRNFEARIARRDSYRVVFNSNGGSYVETRYVKSGEKIDHKTVTPTRDRYTFAGWFKEDGKQMYFSNPITSDMTVTARWMNLTDFELPNKTPITYTSSSAALNVVWKDYDNAFGCRPEEIVCELLDLSTGVKYAVKVTKSSAEFVDNKPVGAVIGQSAGNWTVMITGLEGNFTFVQKSIETSRYTTAQSGTTVVNTMRGYSPLYDDTAWLMTENGRIYDYAGNIIILKGAVTMNAGWLSFNPNTTTAYLKKMRSEGANCARMTIMTGSYADTYVNDLKAAIERTTALGMYCIVDWGVIMQGDNNKPSAGYFDSIRADTLALFGDLASTYKNNPYVIFEICNEPTISVNTGDAWENYVKPFEEEIIRLIRGKGASNLIIAAPNMHARQLSMDNAAIGDDPIDKPFATEISHNVAYTFHCYAWTTTYNQNLTDTRKNDSGSVIGGVVYAWRVCDAIENGLTVVMTEFSPSTAAQSAQSTGEQTYDFIEADKWINLILMNDIGYTLFRGISANTVEETSSQHMFVGGNTNTVNNGEWTYDMLSESGAWFYDNTLGSTGFIKKADFNKKAAS